MLIDNINFTYLIKEDKDFRDLIKILDETSYDVETTYEEEWDDDEEDNDEEDCENCEFLKTCENEAAIKYRKEHGIPKPKKGKNGERKVEIN